MNSPIRYYGGKGTMFNNIIQHFPNKEDYDIYVEPFGGSYSIGLKKEPAKVEIYNDLDKNVYSLYKVLSDPEMFQRFKDRCDLILYSDDIRKEFKQKLKQEISIEDRAFYFFYVNRTSHNGIGGFSSNSSIRRNLSKAVSDFLSCIDRLPELHNRLSRVIVTNTNGNDLIRKYNDPKNMIYCLPENEIVIINGKPTKVQDVKEGDYCSGDNVVTKTHIRMAENEELVKINVMGLGNKFPITMSNDHVIFIYENGEIKEVKGNELKIGDYVIVKPFNNEKNESLPINYINKKQHTKQVNFNGNLTELSELLGFYAAEGHSQNGLMFSFNTNEHKYLNRVKYLIDNVFGIESHIHENSPHPTVSQVRVYGVEVENFFKDHLINGVSTTKKFTDYVMKLHPKYQLEIIKSWLRGDGGIWYDNTPQEYKTTKTRSGNRNKFKITGTSSSWDMINQLYEMALRCQLHPCIKKRENTYDLYFTTKHDVETLTNIRTNGRSCKRRKWVDDFMITPITNITVENYTGNMYDLTTEKGYFYLSFGVKSHNCDPPYEQSTRTGARYAVDMDREGHLDFLDAVINSRSKILISGYDCELYETLTENGFTKIKFEVKTIDGNFNPKIKTETLWKNY